MSLPNRQALGKDPVLKSLDFILIRAEQMRIDAATVGGYLTAQTLTALVANTHLATLREYAAGIDAIPQPMIAKMNLLAGTTDNLASVNVVQEVPDLVDALTDRADALEAWLAGASLIGQTRQLTPAECVALAAALPAVQFAAVVDR